MMGRLRKRQEKYWMPGIYLSPTWYQEARNQTSRIAITASFHDKRPGRLLPSGVRHSKRLLPSAFHHPKSRITELPISFLYSHHRVGYRAGPCMESGDHIALSDDITRFLRDSGLVPTDSTELWLDVFPKRE